MPTKIKSPCAKPGCHVLCTTSRCEAHTIEKKKEHWRETDRHRPQSHKRGYNSWWRRARLGFLKDNPLCVHCLDEGRITAATVVDHKEPHKGDVNLLRDKSNWQSLCKTHHDRKTATEDSNFAKQK